MTRHVNVFEAALDPYDLEPSDVMDGAPLTAELTVTSVGEAEVGIWQITPGVVTDTEADELFVVVSGRATVVVEGGATLEIGPGDAAVLREGDRTTWTVHETLRKAYHITLP